MLHDKKVVQLQIRGAKIGSWRFSEGPGLSKCMDELVYIPFTLIKTFIIRNSSKEKRWRRSYKRTLEDDVSEWETYEDFLRAVEEVEYDCILHI